jgi:hypothetical protein
MSVMFVQLLDVAYVMVVAVVKLDPVIVTTVVIPGVELYVIKAGVMVVIVGAGPVELELTPVELELELELTPVELELELELEVELC